MKRVQAACICQTLHFSQKDEPSKDRNEKLSREEIEKYKKSLEQSRTEYRILVPRILINWHIRLSDCPYAASSSIGNARIASFGFIAYEQSSCVNVPEIYYSVY